MDNGIGRRAAKKSSKDSSGQGLPIVNKLATLYGEFNNCKINTKKGTLFIDVQKIFHCRAEGNYTDIHIEGEASINATIQLGKLEEKLPNDRFFRINRSEIININYLREIRRKTKQWVLVAEKQKKVFSAE